MTNPQWLISVIDSIDNQTSEAYRKLQSSNWYTPLKDHLLKPTMLSCSCSRGSNSNKRGLSRLPVLWYETTKGLPRVKQIIKLGTAAGHESVPKVFD